MGKTVVRFSYWGDFNDNELWRRIIAGFERANPDVEVKREWIVGRYNQKLQLQLISDTAADVIMMDDDWFPGYSSRGYLEDLQPHIERDHDALRMGDLLPTALDSFRFRGLVGGFPWDGNAVLMFYNKDLFDAAGIPYPEADWTWDDFRRIARALTQDLDGDGRIDQFGTVLGFSFLDFEPFIWSYGGSMLDESRTKAALNSDRGIEAAQLIFDMKWEDHSMAWSGEMEGMNKEVQLLTGRVGMVMAGSYFMFALQSLHGDMRWGVAPMPAGPYGDRYTRVTWDGLSINVNSKCKEAAWRFIKYAVEEEAQALLARSGRGLPVHRSDVHAYYIRADSGVEEERALEAADYGRLTPITAKYQQLKQTAAKHFDKLNTAPDKLTPAEALAAIEADINAVLAEELEKWDAERGGDTAPEIVGTRKTRRVVLGIAALFLALVALLVMRNATGLRGEELRAMLRGRMGRSEALQGVLFASPWILGVLIFTAFPIGFSIVLSLSKWDPYEQLHKMSFVGLANFKRALFDDPLVYKALWNTFVYGVWAVPLSLSASLLLAILLNQRIRGITVFRTVFYVPSIVSGVATAILWVYIFNPQYGFLNSMIRALNQLLDWTVVLAFIELPEPGWLADPSFAKPSLILMALWGSGGAGMLIFLAGLQGVPDQLYEVAELDGAGRLRKFWNITLPMLSPTIYFNFVMGIIGAWQVFMQAFVMVGDKGGVDNSLMFYVLYLYRNAFIEYKMGYASALAWILFVLILTFTMFIIRSSALWVYYEGERR